MMASERTPAEELGAFAANAQFEEISEPARMTPPTTAPRRAGPRSAAEGGNPNRRKESGMRVDYQQVFPEAIEAMLGLERAVHQSRLEPELLELVKLRASQLNGCAYCLDMHSKDARARGETEQRLHVLSAWREAPFYDERERAALAWCEALTLLARAGAPDEVYAQVQERFTPEEIVALTLQIVAINGWNRLAVGLRSPVGDYVSPYRSDGDTR